jgi:DNA-binding beta-propeller fold protein YncE
MKRLFTSLIAALLVVAVTGCAGTSSTTGNDDMDGSEMRGEEAAPSFSDVQPLLEGTFAPLMTEDEDLNVSSWQRLVEGSEHGTVVIPYDAEHSLLMAVARRARSEGRAGAPSDSEMQRVRRWIEAGAKSDDGEVPYADVQNRLYVANEAGALVTIIDANENRVIGTVDLTDRGFGPNSKPHDTAVTSDGEHWFVSLIGANRVLKFNRDNEIVGRTEFEVPGLMKYAPDAERLFVGRSMSAVKPPKRIGIIDTPDMSLRQIDVFASRPHALGVTPSGQQAYIASLARNQIAGLEVGSGQFELTSMGGPVNTLVHFDISPDGQTMAAGGQTSGTFFFFDLERDASLTPRVTDSLQLGGQPWHPTYTPSGEHLYVPQKTANAVSVIGADSHEVETTIRHEALAQPHGSAVRADGRYVYVTGSNVQGTYTPRYPGLFDGENHGNVVVIDTRTNEVVKVLRADQDPSGASLRPRS